MRNLESMSCFTSSVTIHAVDLTDDPFKSSLHWKICKYMVTEVFEVLNALSRHLSLDFVLFFYTQISP